MLNQSTPYHSSTQTINLFDLLQLSSLLVSKFVSQTRKFVKISVPFPSYERREVWRASHGLARLKESVNWLITPESLVGYKDTLIVRRPLNIYNLVLSRICMLFPDTRTEEHPVGYWRRIR